MIVGTDNFFHEGHVYVLYIDSLSNFYMVEWVRSTLFEAAKPLFLRWFALFGASERLRSYNGAPFKFQEMCNQFGVRQVLLSPPHPQSNGHVKAGVQDTKKIVCTHGWDTLDMYKVMIGRRNAPLPSRAAAPSNWCLGV